MHFALVSALFVFGLWPQAVQTPARPDFSGQWSLDQQRSTATSSGPAAMFGLSFVAKQDTKTLGLDISFPGGTIHAAYNLDGSESRNGMPGPNGEEIVVSRATWDG